jgi:hypothetical protein
MKRVAGLADKFYPSRSHYGAMDRCRASRLAFGVARTFAWKTLHIEKSSRFKSCKYANQPESRILPILNSWVVLAGWTVLNLPEDIFSVKIHPFDPVNHKLSEKALG